jgi:hypothetical protein
MARAFDESRQRDSRCQRPMLSTLRRVAHTIFAIGGLYWSVACFWVARTAVEPVPWMVIYGLFLLGFIAWIVSVWFTDWWLS